MVSLTWDDNFATDLSLAFTSPISPPSHLLQANATYNHDSSLFLLTNTDNLCYHPYSPLLSSSDHPASNHQKSSPKTHKKRTNKQEQDSPLLSLITSTTKKHPSSPPEHTPTLTIAVAKKKPRRPQEGRSIANNSLRPHVLAADRLSSWRSIYSLAHETHILSRYPTHLLTLAKSATACHAPNTRNTYGAGLLRFHQFCDKWDIAECHRMPADYVLLAAFVGEWKGRIGGGTVRSWLSAIAAWHDVHHAPWRGDDKWLKMARKTANIEGAGFKRKARAPVSIEHLLTLHRAIDGTNPMHAAIWAAATVTFFGCRRLGETLITSAADVDPRRHVLRSADVTFRTQRDGSQSASFHVPWTKTTAEKGAKVIVTARADVLCPRRALQTHLSINNAVPGRAPLFAFQTTKGGWSHLTKSTFLAFCDGIWRAIGLAHVLGHSFRIGGATELLLAGVPPEVVAATGGWSSLAFLLYWRRMEEILPMSTSKAYRAADTARLTTIFEAFRKTEKISESMLSAAASGLDDD